MTGVVVTEAWVLWAVWFDTPLRQTRRFVERGRRLTTNGGGGRGCAEAVDDPLRPNYERLRASTADCVWIGRQPRFNRGKAFYGRQAAEGLGAGLCPARVR